jgi:phosphocarrier protein
VLAAITITHVADVGVTLAILSEVDSQRREHINERGLKSSTRLGRRSPRPPRHRHRVLSQHVGPDRERTGGGVDPALWSEVVGAHDVVDLSLASAAAAPSAAPSRDAGLGENGPSLIFTTACESARPVVVAECAGVAERGDGEEIGMAEARRVVTVVNELGLHARAASKLVQLASKYPVEVHIGREEMMVNAKSIMGVLMLAASKGTDLHIVATGDGDDTGAAVDALVELINGRFGEGR